MLRGAGYSMLLMNSENDPDLDAAHIRFFQTRRVDGMILSLASERRNETLELLGQDSPAYNVPEAILKFRQGFGRLIRSRSDRGVVVILDKRVISKQYGRLFIESLPACTLRRAPLAQLPRDAARWIDGG